MQSIGKHVSVQKLGQPPCRKTSVWFAYQTRRGVLLGKIAWESKQRQYVFTSQPLRVLSPGCLEEITRYMRRETAAQLQRAADARKLALAQSA